MRLTGSLIGGLVLGVLPAQEAPLSWVDGRPVVRATVTAGDVEYPCHLLVDLYQRAPLLLHRNAAGTLRARRVAVRAGGLILDDLPVQAEADTWLEEFTRDHAEALSEVPVAGRLGRKAFAGRVLRLDGPGGTLRLLPPATRRPEPGPGRVTVDLLADPVTERILLPVNAPDGEGGAVLDPRRHACAARDAEAGRWPGATVGELPLGELAAFRDGPVPYGAEAVIGGGLLQRVTTTIHFGAGWLALEVPGDVAAPADEVAFYAAEQAAGRAGALRRFLEEHPDSRWRLDAARALLAVEGDRPQAAAGAALEVVAASDEKEAATAALRLLEEWPRTDTWAPARRRLAEAALERARKDADGTAAHRLHLELGRLDLADGELDAARRHLLGAVFGMPEHGPAHLAMGDLHRARDEPERARARYFRAMLDTEETGIEGYLALRSIHREMTGGLDGLEELLVPWAEGRVPALHPIPRDEEDVDPTGRVVLVELFTGAHCPPCAAADVAFDAVGRYFGEDEVARIQWHLPIPRPEPLVAGPARQRARMLGVRGTPAAFFGGELLGGGGPADQGPAMFASYREALEEKLAEPPVVRLGGRATVRDGTVRLEARVEEGDATGMRLHAVLVERRMVYPGANGLLFHHDVARALLTPAAGVPWNGGVHRAELGLDRVSLRLADTLRVIEPATGFVLRPVDPDPHDLAVVLFVEDGGGPVQAATLPVESADR